MSELNALNQNQIREIQMKVNSGEKMIAVPFKAAGGTDSGYQWLTQVIDVNHDKEFREVQDWPDNFNGRVVTRRIMQTVEIRKPSQLPAGNWDCHIVRWPNMSGASSNFTPTTSRNNNSVTTAALPVPISSPVGGLQIYGVPVGADLNIMQNAGTVQAGRIDIDPTLMKGACRVVADGFEVHNTTATLNKQGSVIVWRQNAYGIEPTTIAHIFPEALLTRGTNYSAQPVRFPPSNSKEAMYLSGSRQWEAARGNYCVGVFQSDENPMLASTNQTMVVLGNDFDGNEGLENLQLNVPVPYQPAPVGTITPAAAVQTVRVHPLNTYGAMYLGLSESTTLTVTLTTHMTVAPGQGDVAIIQLTKPSSTFDPVALETYSKYTQTAVSGCPADENGFADFFFDAARKVAKLLGPVLMAAPHPLAKAVGGGMSYFANSTTSSKKKKQKASPKLLLAAEKAGEKEGKKKEKKKEAKAKKKNHNGMSPELYEILVKNRLIEG